jgi:hypothetical protein
MYEAAAQACDDARLLPFGGTLPVRPVKVDIVSAYPESMVKKPPTNGTAKPQQTVIPGTDGISEENVRILLRAGGIKQIRTITAQLYGFMLRHPNRDWSGEEIKARLKTNQSPDSIGQMLWSLSTKKILKRTERGRYQVS